MVNKKCTMKLKMIMVPYPAQGHVTPMLKLASIFAGRGFEPILITPEFIHNQLASIVDLINSEILCMSIPDGLEKNEPRDFFAIENVIENSLPLHLERIINNLNQDGRVVCVLVDLLMSSAIGVAHRCRVPVAGFWPAMFATYCLIASIPEMVKTGYISDTGSPQHLETVLQNQLKLPIENLPWLIGSPAARKSRFKFWTRTLDRSKNLKWLLVNSFPEEEHIDIIKQQYSCLSKATPLCQPKVLLVGPLSKHSLSTQNPSFWEEDMSCTDWLDSQKPNSVIYISFGSWVSPIGEEKVKTLALTLEALGLPFIWVLGLAWRKGLPNGYLAKVSSSGQGKIVTWVPQMKVLQDKSVGFYLTHCGWNSTMEAIQCGKRLLCYPVAGDQFVNCGYIVKMWKIGVRVYGFGERDIEEGLKKVMEDSEIMKNRLTKLCLRTMGDEARARVMANLTGFIDDLSELKINNDQFHLKEVDHDQFYLTCECSNI